MNFYNYFLCLCNNINMKPSPAGEAAGFTRTAVNGWKRGHIPTDGNLQKLSEFFDVPVSSFHECDDIKARDIKNRIKNKLDVIVDSYTEPEEDKKITVTQSDGIEVKKPLTEREELERLIDRLTDEEVSAILDRVKNLIFGF